MSGSMGPPWWMCRSGSTVVGVKVRPRGTQSKVLVKSIVGVEGEFLLDFAGCCVCFGYSSL